jgi:nucleoside-diphosphate-sugar epimerase
VRVNDLLHLVLEHVGRSVVARHVPQQPGDLRATRGDIDRARRTLGWRPQVPLNEGIKRQVTDQLGTGG